MTRSTRRLLAALALSTTFVGCAAQGVDDPMTFDEAPVSALDPLFEGAPGNDELPEEGKADETYPRRFDLMDIQTPVRSQGSRGVCSIFATAALMESLYRSEGSIMSPDFSEQYLQWSVKTQVMAFTNTDGSSAQRNLEAISRFGIPEESAWPYESRGWGTTQDMACTGPEAMRPVRCWTNGEPPASAREAELYRLPAGRWISTRRRSLMAHMTNRRTPVVVGGDFFYQAWNHGGSMLPVSAEYSRRGIVLYPTPEDITDSRLRPAGHAYLLVGWDEEMQVQRLNGQGQPMVDAMGNPVYETGFFLFKNSWGTGRFGTEGTPAAGYGWISIRYVEEFLSGYVSDVPTVRIPPETCNNSRDDDRDGMADCMDSDCSGQRACMDVSTGTTHELAPMVAIPDNAPTGVSSEIMVAEGGSISSLAVTVDATHPYRGDLVVRLTHAGRTVTLMDRQGSGDDDLHQTFDVSDWNGVDAAGAWTLTVVDSARSDVGTLDRWSLAITRCAGGDCAGAPTARHYESTGGAVAIPDATPAGVSSDIVITDRATIASMSVNVAITHTFPLDLTVRLSRVGGREFVLLREQPIDGPSLMRTFAVDGFVGEQLEGTWRLTVVDGANRDTGTLDSWSIDATAR